MDNNLSGPLVSVLMPVYNGGAYLPKAIESILKQTYNNFEFIIIDDGSTDNSLSIIKKYSKKDKRIHVITRGNQGLIRTLNEGLNIAKGELIARQDSDDISVEHRLQKQVEYMKLHPGVSVVGSNYFVITDAGNTLFSTDVFTEHDDLKLALLFSNQFGHGTVMVRTKLFKKIGLYDLNNKYAEDYDLWIKASKISRIGNIKEPLYRWRTHSQGTSSASREGMDRQVNLIRKREFEFYLNNKNKYKLLSYHPFSIKSSPIKYSSMKNTLFRDMALMYLYKGLRRKSILPMLLAVIYAPWVMKTYMMLFIIIFRKNSIDSLEIEYI